MRVIAVILSLEVAVLALICSGAAAQMQTYVHKQGIEPDPIPVNAPGHGFSYISTAYSPGYDPVSGKSYAGWDFHYYLENHSTNRRIVSWTFTHLGYCGNIMPSWRGGATVYVENDWPLPFSGGVDITSVRAEAFSDTNGGVTATSRITWDDGYYTDVPVYIPNSPGPNSILDAKLLEDGTSVSCGYSSATGIVVTAVFPGFIYVESEDRTFGIRVAGWTGLVRVGDRVSITGTMQTTLDGEKYIEATAVMSDDTGVVWPLGIRCAQTGGGDWNYDPNLGTGQAGIVGAIGLNNIGLLARLVGKVVEVENTTAPALATSFVIDDGSGANVKCVVPTGVAINSAWKYVAVTGMVSCERIDGELHRLLRVRSNNDITVILQ